MSIDKTNAKIVALAAEARHAAMMCGREDLLPALVPDLRTQALAVDSYATFFVDSLTGPYVYKHRGAAYQAIIERQPLQDVITTLAGETNNDDDVDRRAIEIGLNRHLAETVLKEQGSGAATDGRFIARVLAEAVFDLAKLPAVPQGPLTIGDEYRWLTEAERSSGDTNEGPQENVNQHETVKKAIAVVKAPDNEINVQILLRARGNTKVADAMRIRWHDPNLSKRKIEEMTGLAAGSLSRSKHPEFDEFVRCHLASHGRHGRIDKLNDDSHVVDGTVSDI